MTEVRLNNNRKLGSIQNNDINNILFGSYHKSLGTIQNNDIDNILSGGRNLNSAPGEYRKAVDHLLEGKPGILAQNVGLPDAVIYRTEVATTFDKYLVEVSKKNWDDIFSKEGGDRETFLAQAGEQAEYMGQLLDAGTSPLEITIAAGCEHGVPVVASYRMNAEDFYGDTYLMSAFGRAHPEHRIRSTELEKRIHVEDGNSGVNQEFTGALDPAVPKVYEQRMAIFREVAERYDIDGIEFDWRRWDHMISDPHKNHPILTQMVRDTREMLDEVARRRARDRFLLGVRVGPMLDGEFKPEEFPGATSYPHSWWARTPPQVRAAEFPDAVCPGPNKSCRDLGLDVRTWIAEGLVDYVCPSLFWGRLPGLPRTREFVELARDKGAGIYPTVFPLPAWGADSAGNETDMTHLPDEEVAGMMRRHRDEICNAALQCFKEGADGISTFNWFGHSLYSPRVQRDGVAVRHYRGSQAYMKTELFVHAFLSSPRDLQKCLKATAVVRSGECSWQV